MPFLGQIKASKAHSQPHPHWARRPPASTRARNRKALRRVPPTTAGRATPCPETDSLLRLQPFGQPGFDLVSYSAEDGKPLFISPGCARGVLERPVKPLPDARHDRAALVRVVANGDETVDPCLHRFGQYLRGVPADVDAALCHHADRERMHRSLLGAGALD